MPRLRDSKENVENVVKPPQKPTIKKAFNRGLTIPCLAKYPDNRPKRKHPVMLMIKVAKGKGVLKSNAHNLFIRKRQQVPAKPPIPAKIIIFHI